MNTLMKRLYLWDVVSAELRAVSCCFKGTISTRSGFHKLYFRVKKSCIPILKVYHTSCHFRFLSSMTLMTTRRLIPMFSALRCADMTENYRRQTRLPFSRARVASSWLHERLRGIWDNEMEASG